MSRARIFSRNPCKANPSQKLNNSACKIKLIPCMGKLVPILICVMIVMKLFTYRESIRGDVQCPTDSFKDFSVCASVTIFVSLVSPDMGNAINKTGCNYWNN